MNVVLYGATGNSGQRILQELVSRGIGLPRSPVIRPSCPRP